MNTCSIDMGNFLSVWLNGIFFTFFYLNVQQENVKISAELNEIFSSIAFLQTKFTVTGSIFGGMP